MDNTFPLKLTDRSAGRSVALGFAAAFAIASSSGLFYWLLPWSWNWHASQLALVLHLALGSLSLAILLPYSLIHLRDKDPHWLRLFLLWPIISGRGCDRFRRIAYACFWLLALLMLSGLLLSWPALAWLAAGEARQWSPEMTEWLRWLHLGAFFAAAAVLLAHLPRKARATA